MSKEIRFSKDVRDAMLNGVNTLADAVKVTVLYDGMVWYDESFNCIASYVDSKHSCKKIKSMKIKHVFMSNWYIY